MDVLKIPNTKGTKCKKKQNVAKNKGERDADACTAACSQQIETPLESQNHPLFFFNQVFLGPKYPSTSNQLEPWVLHNNVEVDSEKESDWCRPLVQINPLVPYSITSTQQVFIQAGTCSSFSSPQFHVLQSNHSFKPSAPLILFFSTMRTGMFSYTTYEDQQIEPHFLDACFLCRKPLGNNSDIFMYR